MTLATQIPPGERLLSEEPQRFLLPDILATRIVDPSELNIPAELTPGVVSSHEVSDPYLRQIGESRLAEIRQQENDAALYASWRREQGYWTRTPGTAYQDATGAAGQKRAWEWGDPVSHESFFGDGPYGLNDPALRAWQSLIPSAGALTYLSDPFSVQVVFDRRGRPVEATQDTREWLAATTDGIEIRNRTAEMALSVADFVRWYRFAHPDEPITMMSVAGGTAVPTMQSAVRAGAPDASLTLLEKDKRTIEGVNVLSTQVGFRGDINTVEIDVFDRASMAKVKDDLMSGGKDRRPLIVDAMGIFEYTSEQLRTPEAAGSDSLLYSPSDFLRAVHELVRPGGRLIFGQMRDDRPNADFTMGVIRWPFVCMRSPKEVMQIIVDAGIDPDTVSLALTPEGLYTVASIDKPISERRTAGKVGVVDGDQSRDKQSFVNPAYEQARRPRAAERVAGLLRSMNTRLQRALASAAMNIF